MGPRFEDLLDEVRSLEKRDGTRRDSHRSSSTRFAGSPSTIGRYLVLECSFTEALEYKITADRGRAACEAGRR